MRSIISSSLTSALTGLMLTAAPLWAQETVTAPQVAQIEAPSLQQAAPSTTDALPTLPAADAAPQSGLPQAPAATDAAPAPAPTAAQAPVASEAGVANPAAGNAALPDGAVALDETTARGEGNPHRRGGPDGFGGPRGGEHGGLQAPAGTPQIKSGMPHDLSPMGMYQAADIVVKAVMLGLLFGTFVTLTILVYKFFEVALAKRSVRRALKVIRKSQSLQQAADAMERKSDPAAFMTRAALDEYRRSLDALDIAGNDGVKERTRSIVERTEAQAGRKLALGTGVLATIGSTAPFVGLFGTVWGIMNSFIGIAQTQTTNLAVVAPGIAEALLATAIGLVAAIPAVIVYNHFARQIQGYKQLLSDAGAGIERLLSRDLDFRKVQQA